MNGPESRECPILRLFPRVGFSCPALFVVSCLLLAARPGFAADNQKPSATVARPANDRAQTFESIHRPLGDAQLRQRLVSTAESERSLALEYTRVGILDTAFDHFKAALRLDPRDAVSHEGLARIWRDWGFPAEGLASAYRAVYWAPASASAQNTLGTLLSKLGYLAAARERFQLALALSPASAYPLNNLCHLELQQHQPQQAIGFCDAALQRNPASTITRNNLALALVYSGRLDDAIAVFDDAPVTSVGAYNKGMLLLSAGRVESARAAFAEARLADPRFAPALIRLAKLAKTRKER